MSVHKIDPSDFVMLPQGGKQMYVSIHRLRLDDRLIDAIESSSLEGLNIQNTAKEMDGTPFIGNISQKEALMLNYVLDAHTMTPRVFLDLKELFEFSFKGDKIYNGNLEILPEEKIRKIFKEIFQPGLPKRGEFLDAEFQDIEGKLHILYNHILKEGALRPKSIELVKASIMRDRFLSSYVTNRIGLLEAVFSPVYISFPIAGSVARFEVCSSLSSLLYNSSPEEKKPYIGVREVRESLK